MYSSLLWRDLYRNRIRNKSTQADFMLVVMSPAAVYVFNHVDSIQSRNITPSKPGAETDRPSHGPKKDHFH